MNDNNPIPGSNSTPASLLQEEEDGLKYTDKETRLLYVRGYVVRFPPGMEAEFTVHMDNPLPLLNGEGKGIGSANVFPAIDIPVAGKPKAMCVIADALFQYGSPERLELETGVPYFFHPEMDIRYLYKVKTDGETGKSRLQVQEVIITVTGLTLSPEKRGDGLEVPVQVLSDEEGTSAEGEPQGMSA